MNSKSKKRSIEIPVENLAENVIDLENIIKTPSPTKKTKKVENKKPIDSKQKEEPKKEEEEEEEDVEIMITDDSPQLNRTPSTHKSPGQFKKKDITSYFSPSTPNNSSFKKEAPKKVKIPTPDEIANLLFETTDQPSTLQLDNSLFADIANVIEIYNMIAPILCTNSTSSTSKATKKNQKRIINKTNEITFKSINYNKFIKCLTCSEEEEEDEDEQDEQEEKEENYFIQIVKNIIKLAIHYEEDERYKSLSVCEDITLADVNLNKIVYLQEVCRCLVDFVIQTFKVNEFQHIDNANGEIVSLLEKLKSDCSFNPFTKSSGWTIHHKLLLLKVLTENFLLNTENFETQQHNCKERINKLKESIDKQKKSLISSYELGEGFKLNSVSVEKLLFDGEKHKIQFFKKYQLIEKAMKDLQKETQLANNYIRLLPIGQDAKGNNYWHFKFFKGIILEMATSNKWFSFETEDLVDTLINSCLNKDQKNQNLIKSIKELKEDIFSDKNDDQNDGDNKKDEPIDLKSFENIKEDNHFVRRSTRAIQQPKFYSFTDLLAADRRSSVSSNDESKRMTSDRNVAKSNPSNQQQTTQNKKQDNTKTLNNIKLCDDFINNFESEYEKKFKTDGFTKDKSCLVNKIPIVIPICYCNL
jgi:hypothetical protein